MNKLIQAGDIGEIAPYHILRYLVQGVMRKENMAIGIMLDEDESDSVRSGKTGKLFVAMEYKTYCALLRGSDDEGVAMRCPRDVRDRFEHAKKMVSSRTNYRGEICECAGGGLQEFVVPIVEKVSGTFVGVVFGGRKRLKESNREARERLRTFIEREGNQSLQAIPFRTLYSSFLQVEQCSKQQLEEWKSKCERIADEIARNFTFLAEIRKRQLETNAQREAFDRVSQMLIEARESEAFWKATGDILDSLRKWLGFDWGMVLRTMSAIDARTIFEVQHAAGRGIGSTQVLLGRQFVMASTPELERFTRDPEFLSQDVRSIVGGQVECWWWPLNSRDGPGFGVILIGSAPSHRHTEYNSIFIDRQIKDVREILRRIETKYSEISVLENEKRWAIEVAGSEANLKQTVRLFGDMYIALTHQMKRPLITVAGSLSNVRDLYHGHPASRGEIMRHIEAGLRGVQHSQFLTRGCMSIFALEEGSKPQLKPVWIEAKAELKELYYTMQTSSSLSNRKNLRFSFFEENPRLGVRIRMDKDSFLYVFYSLIDNAIKYADSGTKISFVCAQEGEDGPYVLKIKSVGLQISRSDEEKVFKKFGRGENAWRCDETGIGIGCWAAKEHMKMHGGDVSLVTKDRLSVFIVYPGGGGDNET